MENIRINTQELLLSFFRAVDLLSPHLLKHHSKTAFIALRICNEMKLSSEETYEIVLAATIHDIGAFALNDEIVNLAFEDERLHEHAFAGYYLLRPYKQFARVAEIVRFHHVQWAEGNGVTLNGHRVPLGSHIVHVADRIAVILGKHDKVLNESKTIVKIISDKNKKMFKPEIIDAFKAIAEKESFWLEASFPMEITKSAFDSIETKYIELLDLTKLLSRTIDFRSRFTVTHSSGVAACAKKIANLIGFSDKECSLFEIAGYLHDLGKLVIPKEILEKKSALTKEEYSLIRGHTYYTYSILAPIKELYTINMWASYHHERLDGKGYPFRLKANDISLGSRIIAVADVFTAIMEDRPYRYGMPEDMAIKLLKSISEDRGLDPSIIRIVMLHFDEVNAVRLQSQKEPNEEYNNLYLNALII